MRKKQPKSFDAPIIGSNKNIVRWRLLSDDDGHDYLVPVGMEEEFYKWVEESHADDPEFDCDRFEPIGCAPSCVSFIDPKLDD